MPWHLALQGRRFEQLGVDVSWRDYEGGSGAMAKALRDGELDAALLLTEGAVAAVSDGVPLEIISLYTDSPLVWGIHVPAPSRFRAVAEIEGARYAISRLGSGSHLMAFVHARAEGWGIERLTLVTVGNLDGAVTAFESGRADVFFWEKFMTKPLVDAGKFRRVGEFTAPWPAFVVCAPRALDDASRAALERVVAVVLDEARALRARADAAQLIAARYGLKSADAGEWLQTTRWSARVEVAPSDVAPACMALGALGVLPRVVDAADCTVQGSRAPR
ncbi:MAG TPA: PhnD/SsuA/transferrin family substrate-binding protein [Gammaproteobacteria bacterium]|nr:PhnD/SsuA/transferrin family substrate-binding protein [Gammaproteobacteria bacterium]